MLAELAFSVGLIGLLFMVFFVIHRILGSNAHDPKVLLFESLMRRVARPSAPHLKCHSARR